MIFKTINYLRRIYIFVKNNINKFYGKNFHKYYYNAQVWKRTFWQGVQVFKCPLDLWIYQEIIYELKPDIIIESGTAKGGSALFLANICDLIRHGKIITIDILEKENKPKHERIEYITGSSVSKKILELIRLRVTDKNKVMVILDSDHKRDHVLKELNSYKEFVTEGSYIIVEDTNINGHPVRNNFGNGPMEAVDEFLRHNNNFCTDRSREKFLLSFNPKGFLKKINI